MDMSEHWYINEKGFLCYSTLNCATRRDEEVRCWGVWNPSRSGKIEGMLPRLSKSKPNTLSDAWLRSEDGMDFRRAADDFADNFPINPTTEE